MSGAAAVLGLWGVWHFGPWAVVALLLVVIGLLVCLLYSIRQIGEEACTENLAYEQQLTALK
jgi:hypothetical protein